MTKVKVRYDTIAIGRNRIRYKFWPSENGSDPGETPQYIGVLTRVNPEMIERVERAISEKHQVKGIFYPKPGIFYMNKGEITGFITEGGLIGQERRTKKEGKDYLVTERRKITNKSGFFYIIVMKRKTKKALKRAVKRYREDVKKGIKSSEESYGETKGEGHIHQKEGITLEGMKEI